MQNDLVNRIDVLRELAPFRGYIPNCYLDKLIEIMTKLPPAEQPMSAIDFLRHRERMRTALGFQCGHPHMEAMEAAVAVVEKWAQDNPKRSDEE